MRSVIPLSVEQAVLKDGLTGVLLRRGEQKVSLSLASRLALIGVNQLWVADIT